MRVIIFTWEFPPRIVGQLSHYVNKLAIDLVKKSVDTYVVTYHDSWIGYHQGVDGVKVYRVSNPVKSQINILTWVLNLNQEVERVAADIFYLTKREVDLIDVCDWHFTPAAVSLKKGLGIPFVFSIDSLEDHRSHGSSAPLSLSIKGLELLGVDEAERVLVKSEWMKQEVRRIYKTPLEKIDIVSPYSPAWIDEILIAYRKALGISPNLAS
ncbi:MAG: glycosyltransferase [Candidatus Bathyarchaeia archaeon]